MRSALIIAALTSLISATMVAGAIHPRTTRQHTSAWIVRTPIRYDKQPVSANVCRSANGVITRGSRCAATYAHQPGLIRDEKAPTPLIRSLLGRRGGAPPSSVSALTVLSRAVGYAVIAGSMLYKVPQVLRIFRKRSAEGISASMFTLETVGTSMSLLFSVRNAFPFSTYGEAFFILAQNVAILIGISVFDKNPSPPMLALGLAVGLGACALVLSPAFPLAYVAILQTLSIPLLNFSRIPQIVMNYQRKSTGELAPTTLVLQAAGNLARIFTTIVQVQNQLFLLATLVAMAFNGILCYQYFLYRKPSTAADKSS